MDKQPTKQPTDIILKISTRLSYSHRSKSSKLRMLRRGRQKSITPKHLFLSFRILQNCNCWTLGKITTKKMEGIRILDRPKFPPCEVTQDTTNLGPCFVGNINGNQQSRDVFIVSFYWEAYSSFNIYYTV
jgi:hypothetical protein